MNAVFQITDYYQLIALHKALIHAKFARKPIDPIISGSPLIADIANQIIETLIQMEIERGNPKAAENWKIKIDPSGEMWQIALSRVSPDDKVWQKWTQEEKEYYARLLLSPFLFDDNLLLEFVRQVHERSNRDEQFPPNVSGI
jgi:hypothetical protein